MSDLGKDTSNLSFGWSIQELYQKPKSSRGPWEGLLQRRRLIKYRDICKTVLSKSNLCLTSLLATHPLVQGLAAALIAVRTSIAAVGARSNGLSFIYGFLWASGNSTRLALDVSFRSSWFIVAQLIDTSSLRCRGFQSNNYLLISDHMPSTVLGTGNTK